MSRLKKEVLRLLSQLGFREPFQSSAYWEYRYRTGSDSGGGSYGRLATYKAKFINNLVASCNIEKVVELGCGDGNQLGLLDLESYVGLDVSETALNICRDKFHERKEWRFFCMDEADQLHADFDLSMSLDVIYHLVEDEVFDGYMRDLCGLSRSYVLIYSSNSEDIPGSLHVRHRRYSSWLDKHAPGLELVDAYENPFRAQGHASGRDVSHAHFALYQWRGDATEPRFRA